MVEGDGKTSKENSMNLQQQKENDLNCIEAEIERAEQIANAEAAYRNGEITLFDLLWYRIITAKYLLTLGDRGTG
jgi:hypothetical protein